VPLGLVNSATKSMNNASNATCSGTFACVPIACVRDKALMRHFMRKEAFFDRAPLREHGVVPRAREKDPARRNPPGRSFSGWGRHQPSKNRVPSQAGARYRPIFRKCRAGVG